MTLGLTLRDRDPGEVLASYVPRLLATWQPPTDTPGWIEVEGTLVSADISGFTALSERLAKLGREGAEKLTNLLNDCFGRMIEAVNDEGGDILKFGGDALLILFSGPDHVNAACRATADMRTIVARPLTGGARVGYDSGSRKGCTGNVHRLLAPDRPHRPRDHRPGRDRDRRVRVDAVAGDILFSSAAAAWFPAEALATNSTTAAAAWCGHRRRSSDRDVIRQHDWRRRPGSLPSEARSVSRSSSVRPPSIVVSRSPSSSSRTRIISRSRDRPLSRLISNASCRSWPIRQRSTVCTGWPPTSSPTAARSSSPPAPRLRPRTTRIRMLRAARTSSEQTTDFDVRVGVNSGPVFVGDLGSPRRRTFTIMGDAVNLAGGSWVEGRTGRGGRVEGAHRPSAHPVRAPPTRTLLREGQGRADHGLRARPPRRTRRDLDRHVLPLIGRRASSRCSRASSPGAAVDTVRSSSWQRRSGQDPSDRRGTPAGSEPDTYRHLRSLAAPHRISCCVCCCGHCPARPGDTG